MSTATLQTAPAAPPRAAVAFGAREYALTGISLAAFVWLLSPAHVALYAGVAACGFLIAETSRTRNEKLALALAVLAAFLALNQRLPSPGIPFVLWGGFGIQVFFVLRLTDYAASPDRGLRCADRRDRVAQYLLYLFFLPTLFSGPSVTFRDQFKAYRPGTGYRGRALVRNGLLIGWGAVKFFALRKPLLAASNTLLAWGLAGETPYAALGPQLSLWLHVGVWMVYFYVMFSGFTDMATGASRLLGFGLYDNFEAPLVARDPGDYWKRWNVSGRKWLIKHVFYPYWGHRRVTLKIMTTFWASGLWHLAVGVRWSAGAALQLFLAVTIYGAAVAAVAALEGRPWRRAVRARLQPAARWAVRAPLITLTFVFTALIHQVFWKGMTGRPVGEVMALLRGLFGLS